MKLNIKRFADIGAIPVEFEVDVQTEYKYNSRMYVNSCLVTLTGSTDLSSITDQNNKNVTNEWHISGNIGWKNIINETHDILTISSEHGDTNTVHVDVEGFTPENELYRPEINKDIKVKDSNTTMKKIAEVAENYFDTLYPIGSIYKTTSNTIPFSEGTWTKISEEPDRKCIGSQVLYPGASGSGVVNKTSVLGAYGTTLYDGVFNNITTPTGYHKEYRLSFQGTTSGDGQITLYLNNISTSGVRTWSGSTFRGLGASNFFKENDIVLETTFGYSGKGTNLKYSVSGNVNWQFWNVTIHGFLTSNEIWYTWKRTA